jgi:homoserine dehydrogenase
VVTPPLRVAVAGLGTVGCGTIAILEGRRELLAARCGRAVEVVAVSARRADKERSIPLARYRWHDDPVSLAYCDDVDVVLELIGGEDGPALVLTRAALAAGKPVVTANKALLAHRGGELARLAEASGVVLAYEAAVAGGIPIVKALRDGLAGNRVERVVGILNGTCNYILTTMRSHGRDFADVLAEAQALGYAEAEPSLDVDGDDAAHKLALLAAIAFGTEPAFDALHIEGIRAIAPIDIAFAEELGYRIKLLGIARRTSHGVEQRVHPCMIPRSAPLAEIEGVFNAVQVQGDAVGATLHVGPGAGAAPTGSAVVADLCDLARGFSAPAFGVPAAMLQAGEPAPMSVHEGAYYLRLMVDDRPGVLADVAACLRDAGVSVESMIQRHRATADQPVPIVMTTHATTEAAFGGALAAIGALACVREPPRMLRIETL